MTNTNITYHGCFRTRRKLRTPVSTTSTTTRVAAASDGCQPASSTTAPGWNIATATDSGRHFKHFCVGWRCGSDAISGNFGRRRTSSGLDDYIVWHGVKEFEQALVSIGTKNVRRRLLLRRVMPTALAVVAAAGCPKVRQACLVDSCQQAAISGDAVGAGRPTGRLWTPGTTSVSKAVKSAWCPETARCPGVVRAGF